MQIPKDSEKLADNQTKVTNKLQRVKGRKRKVGLETLAVFLVHAHTEALVLGQHQTKTNQMHTKGLFQPFYTCVCYLVPGFLVSYSYAVQSVVVNAELSSSLLPTLSEYTGTNLLNVCQC